MIHFPCDCPNCPDVPDVVVDKIEKGVYMALIPDIPGCCTFGYSRKDAKENALDFFYAAVGGLN